MAKNGYSTKNAIKTHYRLTPIKEIAVRNEFPLREAKEAYGHCRSIVFKETIKEIMQGKININYFRIMDRIFSLTEKYLDNKRLKKLKEDEILYQLNDFSVENELSYSNVESIYSRFNSRLSSFNFGGNKLEEALNYNPELGNNAFKLTKKYFGIQAHNKLNLK